MRLRNTNEPPRVLISGAASGTGLACAEAFADEGAELILCDWDGIALTRTAKQLGAFSRFCDAGAERGARSSSKKSPHGSEASTCSSMPPAAATSER